jgi:pilus assembly protein CpaF
MLFDYGMGVDESGKYLGRLKATGIRPAFSEHLDNFGIKLPPDLFAPEPFAAR